MVGRGDAGRFQILTDRLRLRPVCVEDLDAPVSHLDRPCVEARYPVAREDFDRSLRRGRF